MKQKQLAAAGKILRRCTICKRFHAAYVVEIPEFGKCYLCYSCWKSRQPEPSEATSQEEHDEEILSPVSYQRECLPRAGQNSSEVDD